MKMEISRNNLSGLILELERQFAQGVESIEVDVKDYTRSRTLPQNAAIHLWCTMMAEQLNDAGFSFTRFVASRYKKGYQVDWSPERFKTEVWHKLQEAKFPETTDKHGNISTSKLNTEQVSKVYEECNRAMGTLAGVSSPFPDKHGRY